MMLYRVLVFAVVMVDGELHIKSAIPVYRTDVDMSDVIERAYEMERTVESVQRSNRGGYQSPDVLERLPEIRGRLEAVAIRYLRDAEVAVFGGTQGDDLKVEITSCWFNVNRGRSSNAPHVHAEGSISGVVFLTSEHGGDKAALVFMPPVSDETLIGGGSRPVRMNFRSGTAVLFPSWLEHYVEPGIDNSIRLSLSFNVNVKASVQQRPRYPRFDLTRVLGGGGDDDNTTASKTGVHLLWPHPLWFDPTNTESLDDAAISFLTALERLHLFTFPIIQQDSIISTLKGPRGPKTTVCALTCQGHCIVTLYDPRPSYFDVAARDPMTGYTHPALQPLTSIHHTLTLGPGNVVLAPCGLQAQISSSPSSSNRDHEGRSFVRFIELRI